MKIPLLIQANPNTCVSPVVFLLEGLWRVTGNQKTTKVYLIARHRKILVDNDSTIIGGCSYGIEFEGGSDRSITIEAELCQ